MKIDRVHFYCRNAVRTRDWFVQNIGFRAVGNCLSQHTQTELISLNSACFLISSPLNDASPVAQYLACHPEGIADIAFRVNNLTEILDRSRDLGLKLLQDVQVKQSPEGSYKLAQISGWQDLQHTLIEESGDRSCLPREIQLDSNTDTCQSHITDIDHVVLNVASGQLDAAVELYQKLFDFQVQQSFDIQTSKSGLTSQALINRARTVQFNINQPTTSNSQIQEFIDLNCGSGIQHLALRSQNLIADVAWMQQKNVQFLTVPSAYYQNLKPFVALNLEERSAIEERQILVDGDPTAPKSLLMQVFTQPVLEQPTFFLEFIERRQAARGFGRGNFQALFAAVEQHSENRSRLYK